MHKNFKCIKSLDDNQQKNVFSNNCILKIKSLCDSLAIVNLNKEEMGNIGLNNLSQWFVSLRIATITREALPSFFNPPIDIVARRKTCLHEENYLEDPTISCLDMQLQLWNMESG